MDCSSWEKECVSSADISDYGVTNDKCWWKSWDRCWDRPREVSGVDISTVLYQDWVFLTLNSSSWWGKQLRVIGGLRILVSWGRSIYSFHPKHPGHWGLIWMEIDQLLSFHCDTWWNLLRPKTMHLSLEVEEAASLQPMEEIPGNHWSQIDVTVSKSKWEAEQSNIRCISYETIFHFGARKQTLTLYI